MRNTLISTALAAFALATIVSPAAAETKTVEVDYADLNISSEAGFATLQSRINMAIRQLCPRAELRSVVDSSDARLCVTSAREDADRQVDQLRRGEVKILVIRAEPATRG